MTFNKFWSRNYIYFLTLRRPLHRKLRMRWFLDVSKGKESSFFKSDLTDPPSDFCCASFGNYRFKTFQISFFSGFYIKIIFWVRWFYNLFERMRLERKIKMSIQTNQPLITSFYIKKVRIFCRISDESALIRNFLRNGRLRG